ncbi:ras-like protein [Anaeramoeba flamelloides]|uniref:Ras-like protein n=1 Tax=Anaeramoeba flamelloides TaxID=1746091 RepID=A0AAV8ADJ5_9EUKA|nr:ras-like protein [Anaeramoeba flamelloides]
MFREEILMVKDSDEEPIMLVGNKSDLEQDRQVSLTEREDLAKSMGCKCLETSTLRSHNVEEAFFEIVRQIRKKRQPNKKISNKLLKRHGKHKFGCDLM